MAPLAGQDGHMQRQDWSLIHAQMAIYFAERMPE